MASLVIGLLGRKRSGKDTFAQRLVDAHGFRRFAFADALKDVALHLDPIIHQNESDDGLGKVWTTRLSDIVSAVGWERAKEDPEVRRVLQHQGTGVRELDPDFWLRVVMDQVDAHDGPAVITDVRFPNEYDAVMRDGVTVRILRPDQDTSDNHISEIALDGSPVDFKVVNDGTVADLHQRADEVASTAWMCNLR